jgi:hypothetical protein
MEVDEFGPRLSASMDADGLAWVVRALGDAYVQQRLLDLKLGGRRL